MTRKGIVGLASGIAAAALLAVVSGCFQGEGMTPLLIAAHDGNPVVLKERLAAGDDVNTRSRYGWTALMFASWKGHYEEVVVLLDAGADPNLVSGAVPSQFETVAGTPPTTALQEAVQGGHLKIVRLLLDRGAKPDVGAVAMAGGEDDLGILEELEKHRVNWNERSIRTFHGTALIAAAEAGNRRNLDWLLRRGADPNLVSGSTALKEAVYEDDPETVRFLLERGADPNLAYWDNGETPLFGAVTKHVRADDYSKNLEVIRLLLKHGADRNRRVWSEKITALELLRSQRSNGDKELQKITDPESRKRREAGERHDEAVMRLLDS